MEVGFILKIAGIAIVVAVINVFLQKSGRDDYVNLVSLAGIIITVILLVTKLGELIELVKGVFDIV